MGLLRALALVVVLGALAASLGILWVALEETGDEPGGVMALVHPRGSNPEACDGQAPVDADIGRLWGFNYGGKEWCFTAGFPESARDAFADKPHGVGLEADAFAPFVNDPSDDRLLSGLVQQFRSTAADQGWDERETVDFLTTFVQSLPYTSDEVTTGADEYVRYPVETLIADGGDCEDTSVLLAALLSEMGYGIVLLSPPGHIAVGVQVRAEDAATMTTVQHDGTRYAYVETTGDRWSIGQVPPEWSGQPMEVYVV